MDKYELLEQFISQLQKGERPQIVTGDKEVLGVLAMANKLANQQKFITTEFKDDLQDKLINNLSKPMEQEQNFMPQAPEPKPRFGFPRWAYFTAMAAVIVLIGGLTLWQNQKSNIFVPSKQPESAKTFGPDAGVNTQEASLGQVTAEQITLAKPVDLSQTASFDSELNAALDDFNSENTELGTFGDELTSLDSDLAQVSF